VRFRPVALLQRALWTIAAVVSIVLLLAVLDRADLLTTGYAQGTSSMAPTLPACDGRTLHEGFTYRLRDPRRGEIVVFHARGSIGGPITPDQHSRELSVTKRVIGVPGDLVVGRHGRVFVDGRKADDIVTRPFAGVRLGANEYFLLGDNRSSSQDSRDFGPVPRKAIFARVVLIFWPLGRFGVPGYDKTRVPPGALCRH
jgi:signal peptidase I